MGYTIAVVGATGAVGSQMIKRVINMDVVADGTAIGLF